MQLCEWMWQPNQLRGSFWPVLSAFFRLLGRHTICRRKIRIIRLDYRPHPSNNIFFILAGKSDICLCFFFATDGACRYPPKQTTVLIVRPLLSRHHSAHLIGCEEMLYKPFEWGKIVHFKATFTQSIYLWSYKLTKRNRNDDNGQIKNNTSNLT